MSVDLLEADAQHLGRELVDHEHLPLVRTEASAGLVPDEAGRGATHLVVGEPHRGELEVRQVLRDLRHQHPVRRLARVRVGPEVVVARLDAERVAVEGARHEVAQLAGPAPLALVVGVEEVAPGRGVHPGRRAQPGALGVHVALGVDAQGEPAPLGRPEGLAAEGAVRGEPEVPVPAAHRPEVVLVVVAADVPVVAHGLDQVEGPVAVLVDEATELPALHHQDAPVVLDQHAQGLLEALHELAPGAVHRVLVEHA